MAAIPACKRRRLGGACAVVAALVLTGCGGDSQQARKNNCPNVLMLEKAESLKRFAPGKGRDITDIVFDAGIVDFRGTCEFDKGDNEVDIELLMTFRVQKGPANKARRAAFDYFVAIPRFYPAPEGRKKFRVSIPFRENLSRVLYREKLELTIPLKKGESGNSYDVYVGIQLTPQESAALDRRGR